MLIECAGLYAEDSFVRPRLGRARFEHSGPGLDRVSGKNGLRQLDVVPAEIGYDTSERPRRGRRCGRDQECLADLEASAGMARKPVEIMVARRQFQRAPCVLDRFVPIEASSWRM